MLYTHFIATAGKPVFVGDSGSYPYIRQKVLVTLYGSCNFFIGTVLGNSHNQRMLVNALPTV